MARILVQVKIYRTLRIGRVGHLDHSEACDISQLVREYGPWLAGGTDLISATQDSHLSLVKQHKIINPFVPGPQLRSN